MTNYDRTKDMSVEEMADYIYSHDDELNDKICKTMHTECPFGDDVEPIEDLQRIMTQHREAYSKKLIEANGQAISALEKQIPKRVIHTQNHHQHFCSTCHHPIKVGRKYCGSCGQALKWGEK